MLLTLRPAAATQRPACAALLPGADPAAWLRELGRWEVPASQLRCYLVPESIRSVRPAGLLVVVEGGTVPADVLAPYGVAAGRLYLPTHATLWPAATEAELAAALLWPRQLLHPSIGLVGFDEADELRLTDLLDCLPPRPTDWTRAPPGPAPPARLRQLVVPAPSAADVVQQLQADLGTASLDELPGATPPPTAWQNAQAMLQRRLVQVQLGTVRALRAWGTSMQASRPGVSAETVGTVLKVAALVLLAVVLLGLLVSVAQGGHGLGSVGILVFLLIRLANSLLSSSSASSGGTTPTRSRPAAAPPGWLQRAEQRLGTRLSDLQKRRNAELERLLRLFSENPAEALRYAIPLSSPYLHRGTAPPTAQLGRRPLGFDLGRLGGGQRVDAWDLSYYQADLRRQYLAAAAQETAAGRHQQAAYIHAHLLGDFRAAAQALEQGGLFREAAALWRDHLRNEPAAAQCLERGGLLQEAAELYAKLNQPEKAGDLYQQLDQVEVAARYYKWAAEVLLANHDHPAAARLLATKLHDVPRAGQVLLQGWVDHRQPEVCLRQYFDLPPASAATPDDLPARVADVYRHHTPPARRGPLLHVLSEVASRYPAPEVLAATREVAYDVLATDASPAHLQLLPRFLPDDPLLAGDCSRYASRQPRPAPPTAPATGPHLDGTIEWLAATSYRQQWLAVGRRDDRLHLARSNWYGQVEYYSWPVELPPNIYAMLLVDEQHGPRVLLRLSAIVALLPKVLPRNKHFPEELTVESPAWLPPWPARTGLLPGGRVASARLVAGGVADEPHEVAVQCFDQAGRPDADSSHPLRYDPADISERTWPCELLREEDRYYTYWGTDLVHWAAGEQQANTTPQGDRIVQVVRSPYLRLLCLGLALSESIRVLLAGPNGQLDLQHACAGSAEVELRFVGPAHLVAVNYDTAVLYQFDATGVRRVQEFAGEHSFIAALPTAHRHQFALLESGGRLTLHSMAD